MNFSIQLSGRLLRQKYLIIIPGSVFFLQMCIYNRTQWPVKNGQFPPIEAKNGKCTSGDCRDGYGEMELADGGIYKGQFISGKADGGGIYTGEISYTGTFKDGLPVDRGLFADKTRNTLPGKWDKENGFVGDFDPDYIQVKDYRFVLKPYYSNMVDLSIGSRNILPKEERDTFGLTVSLGSYSLSLAKFSGAQAGYFSGNYFGRYWLGSTDFIYKDGYFATNLNAAYYFNGRQFSTRSQFDAVERQIQSGGSLFLGMAALYASADPGYQLTAGAPLVGVAGALRMGSLLLRLDLGAGYGTSFIKDSASPNGAWRSIVPVLWRSALAHDFENWALGVNVTWRLFGEELSSRRTKFSTLEQQIYMAFRF